MTRTDTTVTGHTSRYEIKDHEWLETCTVSNCQEPRIKCECGHYGHYWLHKRGDVNGEHLADVILSHAHFGVDPLRFRNIWCKFPNVTQEHQYGFIVKLHSDEIKPTWRLNPKTISNIVKKWRNTN